MSPRDIAGLDVDVDVVVCSMLKTFPMELRVRVSYQATWTVIWR